PELVARFERHILSDGDLLSDIPFGHKGLKGPAKTDVVGLLCLRPDCAWQPRVQEAQAQHRPENHDPSTQIHKVISDKESLCTLLCAHFFLRFIPRLAPKYEAGSPRRPASPGVPRTAH